MRLADNNYTRLDDGSFGAFVHTGYGRTKRSEPAIGDTVNVVTKAGETHKRIVSGYVKRYASGVIVTLAPDAEVAAKATKRYEDKSGRNFSGVCPRCHTYCDGDCTAH